MPNSIIRLSTFKYNAAFAINNFINVIRLFRYEIFVKMVVKCRYFKISKMLLVLIKMSNSEYILQIYGN